MKHKTNLSTHYLGLDLKNPVVASSSPFTSSVESVLELERHGIGAVVLKSIFEEQIIGTATLLERYDDYPEAADYLRTYVGNDYLSGFTEMISELKAKSKLPIIASINCHTDGKWIEYVHKIEEAGADAVELNIYILPVTATERSPEIEARYLKIVEMITGVVNIPVSVKLCLKFTNVLAIMQDIYNRGAKGAVLYNRFFEPDIDVKSIEYVAADALSSPAELRNSLRNVAVASAVVPALDLAVSTGVHTGEDAVKAILAGARAVQICSTLTINGLKIIGAITDYIAGWMETNSFDRIADFRGLMSSKVRFEDPALERVQFMKYLPK